MEGNQRQSWIDYKGYRILFSDYSRLEGQQFVDQIVTNDRFTLQEGKKSKRKLLLLTDFTEALGGKEVLFQLRATLNQIAPYILASAVTGVEGIKKHMLNFINVGALFKTRAFSDVEEAKEWLLKQANDG